MMDGLGIDTGISLDDLVETGQYISDVLGRPNGSKVRFDSYNLLSMFHFEGRQCCSCPSQIKKRTTFNCYLAWNT